MKLNIILFHILTILAFTTCTSSKSINYVNKNISHYKFAYQEIVSNNILGIIDQRKIDSLDKVKKYPHLKNLIDKKLICKKNSIYIDFLKRIDFHIKSYTKNFLIRSLFGKVFYTDIIAYDPEKKWLEIRNCCGVINDFGIIEIVEIERGWYYIKCWDTED